MEGIAVLKQLVSARDANAEVTGLDSSTLRFVIEFGQAVDTAIVAREVAALVDLGVDVFQFFPLFEESAGNHESDSAGTNGEFGEFYVLQFPGLERTVDDRTLFSMSHELAEHLNARTVEPDLGTRIFREPVAPDPELEGVVRDLAIGSCFVEGAAPPDPLWALDRTGVSAAWKANPARGAGIRIGQPDTGVTSHVELSGVALSDGFNVFDGSSDPTDPLGGGGNPGHGTATSSVVVSGAAGRVRGPAPEATLVPIRCIESVVLTFNGAAVAKAIEHARLRGCDVITMSLGGTPSRAMKKAIERAIGEGIIVLAAAGNCVKLVVYPARYDDVIAVAGSNDGNVPWRGSCRGSSVDITAPAENVWHAIAGTNGKEAGGGQGTSFAVAITAGVAALWLSHHGKNAVMDAATARGTTVQRLFRDLLLATARTPANWDTDAFGVGIVDAQALLARALADPLPPLPEGGQGVTRTETIGLLAEAWGMADAGRLSDVAANLQFQLELSSLVLEDARVGADAPGGAESMTRQGISPQLAAAIGTTTPAPVSVRPTGRADHIQPRNPVIFVAAPSGPLEGAAVLSPEAARASLASDPDAPLRAVEERLARVREELAGTERGDRLAPLHDQLRRDIESVLERLREGESVPEDVGEQTALEALVQLKGRPSLRVGDDGVDPNDPELGEWAGAILLQPALPQVQRSVGRIDTASRTHAGTGFVVGDGLVMTNRHVLEELAFPTPRRSRPSGWVLNGRPTINFSPKGVDPSRSFRILEVVFSGPDATDRIDLTHLDLAVLRVESVSAGGAALPPPLRLSDTPVVGEGAKLFVIGYPALPTVLPGDKVGERRIDVVRRLAQIYDMKFGVRYLSPGLVMQTPTQLLPDSPRPWVFTHDATSLGGNSGSCVLSFNHQLDVAGLHFAGDWLRANYAHAIPDVRDQFAEFVP
ncbi:Subtilisin E [Arthrobacter sp. Bi26]|uniref:S8 family serine peptidase n=1 Tax=Arthrobacter sp. Bi26 TaxID=2822350 RepID=UPI001E1797C4|nr:S8 family serine peptidase [Arthrobacter sp. Bi26]CAH0137356.1 Subtilisin E [Arthrobacter sp. Bi26]